ncbi:hypothetical protein I6E29_02580 [Arcanobacterium haemolyticum]|nr:hypothetical protein [Arcanobacterium haemolyticum]
MTRKKSHSIGVRSAAMLTAAAVISGGAFIGLGGAAFAAEIETDAAFQATGMEAAGTTGGTTALQFARIAYKDFGNGGNTINVSLTKKTNLGRGWDASAANPYAGQVIFTFNNKTFYEQIASITVSGVAYAGEQDGRLWKYNVVGSGTEYGLIGSVTESDVVITLKDGATLESLGLAETPLAMDMVWTNMKGQVVPESMANTIIEATNNLQQTDENMLVDAPSWMRVHPGAKVIYDPETRTIKTLHTFTPTMDVAIVEPNRVYYPKEYVPEALLPYFEDTVNLYRSDIDGKAIKGVTPQPI